MSNEAHEFDTDIGSEQAISEYLVENPDFFERHGDLIAKLKIPHVATGGTTSLVERQVSILRQRNKKLDGRLGDLVQVAQQNNDLAERIHQLAINLIGDHKLTEVLSIIEASLRENFAADDAVLLLFHDPELKPATVDTHFCRSVPRNLAGLAAFSTFMATNKPRCGQLRDAQREFLFGDYAEHVASAALVPLGEHAEFGLLGVGSKDPDHFNPAMGTDFLDRISGLISQAVSCADRK